MIDEQSVRAAITVIRETYFNEESAEKVANAIEEYMNSDVGKNRIELDDPGIFIWEINSILMSITHDVHFGFTRT